MELRNINTFLRVVDQQSFSKAAQLIGYTQSTVTAQIQALERELGVALFDRFNKSIRLTPQGEKFLGYAREIAECAEKAKQLMKEEEELAGSLRLSMASSICTTYFPKILSLYHETYPKVQLCVDTDSSERIIYKLHHNEIDLAYTFDQRSFQKNQEILLEHEEPVYFVCHPDFRRHGSTAGLAEISKMPLLLTEKGSSYREHLDSLAALNGVELEPVLELGNTEMLKELVLEKTGVSFLPAYVIRDEVRAGRLAVLNTPQCRLTEWRQVLKHRDKRSTPQMEAMIQILKEMCEDTPPLL